MMSVCVCNIGATVSFFFLFVGSSYVISYKCCSQSERVSTCTSLEYYTVMQYTNIMLSSILHAIIAMNANDCCVMRASKCVCVCGSDRTHRLYVLNKLRTYGCLKAVIDIEKK